MKKLGRNIIAVGAATLLITSAASLAANAAEEFTGHAEAQFISAGDEALGALLETIADEIEGVEATCEPSSTPEECTQTQANEALLSLPLFDLAGLQLGAANNFASGDNTDGSSRAASGAVSDTGTINTGGGGEFPADLQLDLNDGALSPLTALANAELSLGAISATAELESPEATDAVRDYNIAGGELVLTVPALETVLDGLEDAVGETIGDVDEISLTTICTALADVPALDAICDAVPALVNVQINTPTLNSVLGDVTNLTEGGVAVNLTEGTITVNINATLAAAGLNSINDLPPNTDLLAYVLPAVVTQTNTAVSNLTGGLVSNIVNNSSITLTLLETLPITLSADQLNILLDPVTEGLEDNLPTLTAPLASALTEIVNGIAPLLQVIVNVPDVADTTLVGEDQGDPSFSQTAVRVLLAGGEGADLRLATAVVGPNEVVQVDDDDAVAGDDTDGAAAGDDTDGAIADSDTDGVDGGVGDGGGQGDADVVTSLPNAGAPNLLPFWLLGAGLIAFGGAVLLNERRRTALI